ncbi:MAG: hypothetical protein V2A74_14080 [bacterium]
MKRIICILGLLLVLASVAGAQTYSFEKEIAAYEYGGPMAAGPGGGIYYATFVWGSATSSVYYIADPLTQNTTSTQILVTSTNTFDPAGRGYQGIAVNSTETKVYVSGDKGGTLGGSVLQAVTKSGNTFTVDSGFAPTNLASDRMASCALLSDSVLATTQFDVLQFYNASTGALSTSVSGGTIYQRDIAFNSSNNDIYVVHNGNSLSSSVSVWSGGSAASPGSYTFAKADLVADGGINTTYGSSIQGICYDAAHNRLLAADRSVVGGPQTLRIFDLSGTGASATATLAQTIDGTGSPAGLIQSCDDAVVSGSRIYIMDGMDDSIGGMKRILVYVEGTGVHDWLFFE